MAESTAAPSDSGAGDQSGAPKAAPADPKASTVLTDAPKTDPKPADEAAAPDPAKAGDAQQDDAKKDGEPSLHGAPEAYTDFQLPEGTALDQGALGKFLPLAKKLNLSQEGAQEVVNLYAAEILPAINQQLAEVQAQKIEQWLEQSRTDKEIGGAQFDASVEIAKKALATFGTPELKAALDDTGLGNHPEVIRLLANIGRRISEDGGAAAPSADGAGQRSAAEILYGKTN